MILRNLLLYLAVLVVIVISLGASDFISTMTIPGTLLFAVIGYPFFSTALKRVEPAVRHQVAALEPKRSPQDGNSEGQEDRQSQDDQVALP
ncbi:MAG: hypothetical protein K1X67_01485 [Fimbriimonadaceae bacterium]|nr:hypothetical protein [Fimbriimonadaceae bacterium]